MTSKTRCGLVGVRGDLPGHTDDRSASAGPARAAGQTGDGTVSSADYAGQAWDEGERLRSERGRAGLPAGRGRPSGGHIDLDYYHPLEDWLGRRPVRWLLGWLSRARANGRTIIEEILDSYSNPQAPGSQRFRCWPAHRIIDWLRGPVPAETVRQRVAEHAAVVRGLVVTARSIAEFGLTLPQRFSAPLFAVWNFTNRCNLSCRHCYQDAGRGGPADELALAEKLDLVDQAGRAYVPMIALAGGEPTISPHLLPVLHRCQSYGIHTSLATNGTTLTRRLAAELADAGVRYVEVSLDSVRPERHDAFRGQPGMWRRSVEGMRAVVAQEGLRLGVAMCVHQGNFGEVEDMLRFAVDIGASCFAHFNFIPVGRGQDMADGDLTPRQREHVLRLLNEWMQSGRIGVISTAPQLGRVCLAHAPVDVGRVATSHAGSGGGWKTRVVAKYLGGCGAGRTYVCIEPNGDVTPCVYIPHRVLGNVRRRRLVDIFRDNSCREPLWDRDRLGGHCRVCRFKLYCGGCRARADAYQGDLVGCDPGCIFNDRHWAALVDQAGHGPRASPASSPAEPARSA